MIAAGPDGPTASTRARDASRARVEGPPAVELDGVQVVLGGRAVLDDAALAVVPGERVALVGPSGSGKSTLLRVIAGLVDPDQGRVAIDGRVVAGPSTRPVPPERRHVGLVFQDHALFPHLTVAANVAFGLHRRPRAERTARVAEVQRLVHVEDLAERHPHELSGGEAQRVALARALAPEPAVLLLDEPFASLDPDLRTGLRTEVAGLLAAAGTAAVLVTHDHAEAADFADRVLAQEGGRPVAPTTRATGAPPP